MNLRKKRFLITTIISIISLLIFSLVGLIYVYYNLLTYQIYYAKHMPHAKDTNPEMALLLDRLDYLGDSPVEGIRYDTDGHNSVIKENEFAVLQTFRDEIRQYEVLPYKKIKNETYSAYFFDGTGKFVSYYYQRPYEHKDIYEDTDTRKQEAQTYIDEVIDPIVKKMYKKPTINIQWIFNWKYEKRFSGE